VRVRSFTQRFRPGLFPNAGKNHLFWIWQGWHP
jgi:hypothetical protein